MKRLALLLLAISGLLVSCQDASWLVAVNNTDGTIYFRTAGSGTDSTETRMYTANLGGDQEVPPTGLPGTGIARFHVMHDGTIRWSLRTSNLNNIIMAHIHFGEPGQNGPVVVPLFAAGASGPVSGLNIRGAITDSTQVALVLGLFQLGDAYVNVHTTEFPAGAIRGQVEPKAMGGGGATR